MVSHSMELQLMAAHVQQKVMMKQEHSHYYLSYQGVSVKKQSAVLQRAVHSHLGPRTVTKAHQMKTMWAHQEEATDHHSS